MKRLVIALPAFLAIALGCSAMLDLKIVQELNDGVDTTVPVLRRSLSFAPMRSRYWLALSALERQTGWNRVFEMAYMTGNQKAEDVCERIKIVIEGNMLIDPLVRELVKNDLFMIEHRAPQLRSIVISTYSRASLKQKASFVEFFGFELNSLRQSP